MKQIGSRQESSLIGGLGTCGRELCCSTWKSTFETVTTTAARYQNLAINQTKLTGQCGRLKCCLNYELDTYLDALGDFPKKADTLKLEGGYANLVKTDIFKGIMFYSIQKDNIRGPLLAIDKDQVKKLQALNKKGILIKDINAAVYQASEKEEINEDNIEHDFADVTGEIELPAEKRRKKSGRNRKGRGRGRSENNRGRNSRKKPGGQNKSEQKGEGPSAEKKEGRPTNKNKKRRPNRNNKRKKVRPNSDNSNKPNKGDSNKN